MQRSHWQTADVLSLIAYGTDHLVSIDLPEQLHTVVAANPDRLIEFGSNSV